MVRINLWTEYNFKYLNSTNYSMICYFEILTLGQLKNIIYNASCGKIPKKKIQFYINEDLIRINFIKHVIKSLKNDCNIKFNILQ